MNIAFLTPEYITTTGNAGGLATYLRKVTQMLHSAGHSATVITLSEKRHSWLDNGVHISEVRRSRIWNAFAKPFGKHGALIRILDRIGSSVKVEREFWHLHKSTQFDIVQTSSYMTPGLTLVNNRKVPVVNRISSYTPLWRTASGRKPTLAGAITDYLEIRQALLSESSFAPSMFLVRYLQRISGLNLRLIRTPMVQDAPKLDQTFFNEQGLPDAYLLYFGTLNRVKGVDLLAEALPQFFQQNGGVDIVVIGRDHGLPTGMKLFDHIASSCGNCAGRLHYYPSLPKEKLYPFVKNALGVLIPSRVDNYPNACLEAQLFGIPVIGAVDSSLEEMIVDGVNGFLCQNGDAQSLCQSMLRCVYLSPSERQTMKERIIEVNDRLNRQNWFEVLIAYYQEILRDFDSNRQLQ